MSWLDTAERWVVAAVLGISLIGLFQRAGAGDPLPTAADRALFDRGARLALPQPESQRVTVVLVDDESLVRLGERWPISRLTWARFIRAIDAYKPSVIALDAWFETPAPSMASALALDTADKLRLFGLDAQPAGRLAVAELEETALALDGDRQLAAALAESGRVVLGAVCQGSVADAQGVQGAGLTPLSGAPPPSMRCAQVATSLPSLATTARTQGGLKVPFDPDGVVRRYPYLFGYRGEAYPSLALAAAQVAHPGAAEELVRELPPPDGTPLLRPVRSDTFKRVRFSDVLEVPAGDPQLAAAFEDRVVLVGVSALGTEDFRDTPLEVDMPGVYIQAAAVWNLLEGAPLESSGLPSRGGAGAGALLLIGVALAAGRSRRPGPVILGGLIGGGAWLAAGALELRAGALIPVVPVAGGLGAWMLARLSFQIARGELSRRRARALRRAFGQYLAPAVVAELEAHPERLKLGGERREITAFFSDVQGFTGISEALEPSELVALLNACLGRMTDLLIAEGGTVDKYIGDAIVAMFGAPLDQADHAAAACRAALKCQAMLARERPRWEARGWPPVHVRIGLNSGAALVGNMGSEKRFDYTMLGDAVNLAARLEGTNSVYRTWILAGEQTRALAGEAIAFRELDLVRVKGKLQPVRVYEVLAEADQLTEAQRVLAERSAAALRAWRGRRWAEARAILEPLAAGGDPWAAVFLERTAAFEASPPPPDWDGVFVMTTK